MLGVATQRRCRQACFGALVQLSRKTVVLATIANCCVFRANGDALELVNSKANAIVRAITITKLLRPEKPELSDKSWQIELLQKKSCSTS